MPLQSLLADELAAPAELVIPPPLFVLFEQPEGHGLQGLRRGADLSENVDAVLALVHHARDAPHLAFDPAQALEVVRLVCGVSGHDLTVPTRGIARPRLLL